VAASSGARRRCSPFRAPSAVRPGKPPPTRLASRYRLPTPPQTGARHAEAIDCYSMRCAVESATIDKAVVDSRLRPSLPGAAFWRASLSTRKKSKDSPNSTIERRVLPELIPVLGSRPAGDVSHKPGGRLPLLSARPAFPPQPLRGLLPILLLGEQRHNGCKQFA